MALFLADPGRPHQSKDSNPCTLACVSSDRYRPHPAHELRFNAHMWPQAGSTPGAPAAQEGPQRTGPASAFCAASAENATSSVSGAPRAAAVVLPPAESGSTVPPSRCTGAGSVRATCMDIM